MSYFSGGAVFNSVFVSPKKDLVYIKEKHSYLLSLYEELWW